MKLKSEILKWGAGAMFLLFAIGALVAPFGLSILAESFKLTIQIKLPLLAISGVSVLLVSLALVSISFATFNLSDKTQALGLPDGSIRAVIALILLVIFAIVAFSFYADISEFDSPNKESVDFAKQVLTIVGTLVTSLSSFYFGAKTATSATNTATAATADTMKSAPRLRSVDPTSYKLTDGLTITVKVAGDNLDLIKELKIVKGNDQIVAPKVLSNASEVTCQLTLQTTSEGIWDVVVTDGMGRQSKLSDALNIS